MNYRKVTALTVGALLMALPSASASPDSERTKSGEYHAVAGNIDDRNPSVQGEFSNAVTFTPRAGEGFVTVSIEDRSGLPTRALVIQRRRSNFGPRYVLKEEICGHSEQAIPIRSDLAVRVSIQDGPCADGTNAAATFGTVEVTFTR